jgi:uncharacterized coiled-coil protein SlyX
MAVKAIPAAPEAIIDTSAKTEVSDRSNETQAVVKTRQADDTTAGNGPVLVGETQQNAEHISSASTDQLEMETLPTFADQPAPAELKAAKWSRSLESDTSSGWPLLTSGPAVSEAATIIAAKPKIDLGSPQARNVLPRERDTVTLIPLAADVPYVFAGLDDQTFHTTLSGFVQEAQGQYAVYGLTLYYRILPGVQDAHRRFSEHEGDTNYSLDGCKGIEEYIKKLGLKPATIRKWRQRDKERQFAREIKLLAGGPETCAECGRGKGHAPCCSQYEEPKPEALTALESKFVDASVKQHAALQEFYAGRTDAEDAIKAIVSTIPDHNQLEEYVERGSDAVETNKKVEEQQLYISDLGEQITSQNQEIARLQAEIENLGQRIKAINTVPENLRDEMITTTLAAEPDTISAGEGLTAYLITVAERVLPLSVALGTVDASVTLVGRNHRIMIGDWLEKQNKNNNVRILAKCTAIGECEQRRRVKEWDGKAWGKEHVVYSGDESNYLVITEERARKLAPEAFAGGL